MKLCLRSSFLRLLRYHHQLWERHKLLPSGDGSDHFSALNESLPRLRSLALKTD